MIKFCNIILVYWNISMIIWLSKFINCKTITMVNIIYLIKYYGSILVFGIIV